MTLINTLKSDDQFTKEQLAFIIKSSGEKDGYLALNYIESRLIAVQGKNFVAKNHNKIQYIMSILLKNDIDMLFDFYAGCFNSYMECTKNNYSGITTFNLTFVVLIHISLKIIREYN